MTPRPFARTPSVTAEDASEQPQTLDFDSGDESLPPHTSEIGTLKKLPNQGTAWLGSSSGVYFVNTVRRAFSAALLDANASTIPATEDILTGEDAEGRNYNGPVIEAGRSVTEGDFRKVVLASLGQPPTDRALAMDLVTSFFRCWHPLFPFMHGPRFLQDIDAIYSMPDITATRNFTPAESRRVATFQLIINIASLDRRDLHLPVKSRIKSTADVTRVAGCFSVNHDIAAIQLLIAAELYLVATIALRQASTVAGMILKLIYHAGLHRCPLRYASLSLEDCEIRKRIFWAAYALDRYLSLSLGDPNTVQDNDIDVCLSGRELHKAVAHELIINPADELKMHMPQPTSGPHGSGSPSDDPRVVNINDGPQGMEKAQREAAMTAYVHYGKLTGRIIEIFHKSIHARFQPRDAITFLNSDIETWWNDLPNTFTDEDDEEDYNIRSNNSSQNNTPSNTVPGQAPTQRQLAPFFLILYHQLQLLLNRPRLSLDQSTAEFQHGLQVCIKASRGSLTALRKHRENGQSMLLPGLLSAAWMAGLIIAFACQLSKYPKTRAVSDISNCLGLLESMGYSHWFTVKNCHKVLSLLLKNIKSRKAGPNGFLSATQQPPRGDTTQAEKRKRMFEDPGSEALKSPKRPSVSDWSPASFADYRMPPPPSNSALTNPKTPALSNSKSRRNTAVSVTNVGGNSSPSAQASQVEGQDPNNNNQSRNRANVSETDSPFLDTKSIASASGPPTSANRPTSSSDNVGPSNVSGSALYSNLADIAYAQSNHNLDTPLPTEGLDINDPMFWGNFDYNMSDIFGAASWENMIGGSSGMGGQSSWGDLFGGSAGS